MAFPTGRLGTRLLAASVNGGHESLLVQRRAYIPVIGLPDDSEKLLHVFLVAESHDAFNQRSIIPAPIEDDHFTTRREMLHIALEIPLS